MTNARLSTFQLVPPKYLLDQAAELDKGLKDLHVMVNVYYSRPSVSQVIGDDTNNEIENVNNWRFALIDALTNLHIVADLLPHKACLQTYRAICTNDYDLKPS